MNLAFLSHRLPRSPRPLSPPSRWIAALLLLAANSAFGQATPTAARLTDLQIGGGYAITNSDYVSNRIRGFAFYTDVDFRRHLGVELNFHQSNDPNSSFYERTYEAGVRYFRHYGRFAPYVKGLYGRGVFNTPAYEYEAIDSSNQVVLVDSYSNLAYNMFVGGGGVDIALYPRVNLRADFEYQYWLSGPGISNGLTPTLFTIGAAYHFPAGNPRKR